MMFKEIIRKNYNECRTKEDFFKIRQDLKNYTYKKFRSEFDSLIFKYNPLANIVLGKSREKFVIDFGKFMLTVDRYDANHYLMIPKDLTYFNVLTLTKEDIPMLLEMKRLTEKHLGDDNVLFFHCYPFNSIHTLHMHIINQKFYIDKRNNLKIDDVIYVLENENIMLFDNKNSEEILENWFSNSKLSIVNMYIAALILIEQSNITEDKKEYIDSSLNIVLDFLLKTHRIENKEIILEYIEKERENLEGLREILFTITKNPSLLQKQN